VKGLFFGSIPEVMKLLWIRKEPHALLARVNDIKG
jgi:hypothetical protein